MLKGEKRKTREQKEEEEKTGRIRRRKGKQGCRRKRKRKQAVEVMQDREPDRDIMQGFIVTNISDSSRENCLLCYATLEDCYFGALRQYFIQKKNNRNQREI